MAQSVPTLRTPPCTSALPLQISSNFGELGEGGLEVFDDFGIFTISALATFYVVSAFQFSVFPAGSDPVSAFFLLLFAPPSRQFGSCRFSSYRRTVTNALLSGKSACGQTVVHFQ